MDRNQDSAFKLTYDLCVEDGSLANSEACVFGNYEPEVEKTIQQLVSSSLGFQLRS